MIGALTARTPKRVRSYAAVAGVIALVLTAIGATQSYSAPLASAGKGPTSLAGFVSQELTWSACPGQPPPPDGATRVIQCATIQVPLDYQSPDGETIPVALSRLPAADQQRKKGTMVVHPGGPGIPGVTYPLTVDTLDSGRLGQVYDLVGFDPRGVGASTPISCGLSPEHGLYNFFPIPSAEGIAPDAAMAKSIADTCQKNAGDYLPHLNTANAARDLEVIRNVLGLEQFAYLGNGYAATFAVNYMSQFPGRVSKAVFDSLPNITVPLQQADLRSAPAFENRFRAIATKLGANDAVYGLGTTRQAVQQTYLDKLAELDAQPQQLADLAVDGYLLRAIMYGAMYVEAVEPLFGTVLSALVHHQNEEQAAQFARTLNTLPILVSDHLNSSMLAIGCSDTRWDRNILTYQLRIAVYSKLYPVGGGGLANISACAFWPVKAKGPLPKVDRHGPRNILILHSTTDPITAHDGAVAARNAMGPRARMVSVEMGGTGVLTTGLACPTNIMDDFLVQDSLPSDDVTCAAR